MSNLISKKCIFCGEQSDKEICFLCLGDGKRTIKSVDEKLAPCQHEFIANSGKGGAPQFRIIKKISRNDPMMRAKCGRCHYYFFINKSGWEKHKKPLETDKNKSQPFGDTSHA